MKKKRNIFSYVFYFALIIALVVTIVALFKKSDEGEKYSYSDMVNQFEENRVYGYVINPNDYSAVIFETKEDWDNYFDGNDKNNAQYPGANYADMSQVFMDLDMDITNALMLDGGGSSNMLVEENGVLELKTHIYSNGGTDTAYGTERALADALVIIKD